MSLKFGDRASGDLPKLDTPKKPRTPAQRRQTAFKVISLVVLCVVFIGIYFAVLDYEAKKFFKTSIITQVYAYADAVLIVLFALLNAGFSSVEITPDMFSAELDRETAIKRAARINKNKKIAKWLVLLIIPISAAIFTDVIILFWGDGFKALFAPILEKLGV